MSLGSSTDFEPVCGRPHGVRLDRHGQLIVADSYFGLHSVDPQTGAKTVLVSSSQGDVCEGFYHFILLSVISRRDSPQVPMAFLLRS